MSSTIDRLTALAPALSAAPVAKPKSGEAFESYLVETMVKEMRKTVPDGMFSGSELSTFGELFDHEIAARIAENGSLGVARWMETAKSHGPAPASYSLSSASAAGFRCPVRGCVTSPFGERTDPIDGRQKEHKGLDIGAAEGTPVHATAGGTVRVSGFSEGYGNYVVIDHADGWSSVYGHLAERSVQVGDNVLPTTEIGRVGATGRATGPHLHFELRHDDQAVDPAELVGLASPVVTGTAQAFR